MPRDPLYLLMLQVRLLPETSSGHKFKVIGITVSATSIYHLEDIFQRGAEGLAQQP